MKKGVYHRLPNGKSICVYPKPIFIHGINSIDIKVVENKRSTIIAIHSMKNIASILNGNVFIGTDSLSGIGKDSVRNTYFKDLYNILNDVLFKDLHNIIIDYLTVH